MKFLFSPLLTGAILIMLAVVLAMATFTGNSRGAEYAYDSVYNARWFELLILLLVVNIAGQMLTPPGLANLPVTTVILHFSFIVIIIGAGITRYFGWEGQLHLRESQVSNICLSKEKYIRCAVENDSEEIMTWNNPERSNTGISRHTFRRKIRYNGKMYKLELAGIIRNALETVGEEPGGKPMVELLVIDGDGSRSRIVAGQGETVVTSNYSIGFDVDSDTGIQVKIDSGKFFLISRHEVHSLSMTTRQYELHGPLTAIELKPMQVVIPGTVKIVPLKLSFSGTVTAVPVDPEQHATGRDALVFNLSAGNKSRTFILWDGLSDTLSEASCSIDDLHFKLLLGYGRRRLPFSLELKDFVLERYPGSESPSDYRSEILLADTNNRIVKPFSVSMNKVLKYKEFRFYQSSFDADEKGTILSVNRDQSGIVVTFCGYALLLVSLLISLVRRNAKQWKLKASVWRSPLRAGVILMLIFLSVPGNCMSGESLFEPGRDASDEAGKILAQDQKGRTVPLLTISNDILMKIYRGNSFEKYSSMQVLLGLWLDFENWKNMPLIKVQNRDLQKELGTGGSETCYSDLVHRDGSRVSILNNLVRNAYAKPPAARSRLDKEAMKVDERINIMSMAARGSFMRIIPDCDSSQKWVSIDDAMNNNGCRIDSLFPVNPRAGFTGALRDNNVLAVKNIVEAISYFQSKFAGYPLPSGSRIKAEIMYYKLGIFEKLFLFYVLTGIMMLIVLLAGVTSAGKKSLLLIRFPSMILRVGFVFHSAGLALRWYVSGHFPASNGYETMIFISWVTILAGMVYNRRAPHTLAATACLSGIILLVARMSYIDPEITNLVPVLKSRWLTLHVSVVTGSYGFLGLGAILALVNMIMLSVCKERNRERISATIDVLTLINYKSLNIGLSLFTAGTLLGAVWANTSWGSYWSWDPKETWSLITIIVYTFVTHSILIPGLKDIFSYNFLSLYAFSSVLMTYFGVNYYLTGLHSYASGDPFSMPALVYIIIAAIATITFIAYTRYRSMDKARLN